MTTRLFTQKERNTFEHLCQLKQPGVMSLMRQLLIRRYGAKNVEINKAYLLAKGTIPVAVVAHADTVFKDPPKTFFYDTEKNVMWSPDGLGADDRAGIFIITRLIHEGLRPHVIITTDEECGCIGASKLVGKHITFPYDLKFIIQLDRRNSEDSVYYDCDNEDFEKFINQFGFKTAWGTLSDISVLAPVWKVAAVNFSVGYVFEHSEEEHLYVNAMFNTFEKVKNILNYVSNNKDCPVYEYIEAKGYGYGYNYGYGYGYSKYSDYWIDDGYDLLPASSNPVGGVYNDRGVCCFCEAEHDVIDLILLNYDNDSCFYICNNCYSRHYERIEWCSQCHDGWFLTKEELKTHNYIADWKCRICRGDCNCNELGQKDHSGTSEPSADLFSRWGEQSGNKCLDGALDGSESADDRGNEWSGL